MYNNKRCIAIKKVSNAQMHSHLLQIGFYILSLTLLEDFDRFKKGKQIGRRSNDPLSKKILPFQYPYVTSWQWQANAFAILTNYPETEPWIMSHFIQLQLTSNHGSSYVDFYRTPTFEFCPWLFHQHLKRDTIQYFNQDICSFFIDMIDRENYIYGILNQAYFLPGGLPDGPHDWLPHDSFIYGYDREREVFHMADFTFTGKYSFAEVPFDKLEKAYHSIQRHDDWLYLGKGGISLLSFRADAGYDFNLTNAIEQLEGFLTGHNCFEKSRELTYRTQPYVSGLQVYTKLIEDLHKIIDGRQEADYRPFHVICDHKALMIRRISYLERQGLLELDTGLSERYRNLENEAVMCRNFLIKYTITNDSSIIGKVIAILTKMIEQERDAVQLLLSKLTVCAAR